MKRAECTFRPEFSRSSRCRGVRTWWRSVKHICHPCVVFAFVVTRSMPAHGHTDRPCMHDAHAPATCVACVVVNLAHHAQTQTCLSQVCAGTQPRMNVPVPESSRPCALRARARSRYERVQRARERLRSSGYACKPRVCTGLHWRVLYVVGRQHACISSVRLYCVMAHHTSAVRAVSSMSSSACRRAPYASSAVQHSRYAVCVMHTCTCTDVCMQLNMGMQ